MTYEPKKTPREKPPKSLRHPTAQKYDAGGSSNVEKLPSNWPYNTNWKVTKRREDDTT
jgi:hypothetical protein